MYDYFLSELAYMYLHVFLIYLFYIHFCILGSSKYEKLSSKEKFNFFTSGGEVVVKLPWDKKVDIKLENVPPYTLYILTRYTIESFSSQEAFYLSVTLMVRYLQPYPLMVFYVIVMFFLVHPAYLDSQLYSAGNNETDAAPQFSSGYDKFLRSSLVHYYLRDIRSYSHLPRLRDGIPGIFFLLTLLGRDQWLIGLVFNSLVDFFIPVYILSTPFILGKASLLPGWFSKQYIFDFYSNVYSKN